jgi:lysophospholipase L1-like esterase
MSRGGLQPALTCRLRPAAPSVIDCDQMHAKPLFVAALILLTAPACTRPAPTAPSSTAVSYIALGASDANGVGSSQACIGSCTNGKGYVPVLAGRLTQAGKQVTLSNLGIPTAVLSPEIQEIATSIGRLTLGNFITNELPFVTADATLITMFAGANDANVVGSAVRAGLGGSDPNAYIATRVQNFGRDVRALVSSLHTVAPQARLVFLNTPNLAAMPYAASLSLDEKRILQQISVGFSAQVNALVNNGVLVVDLMCDARSQQPSIFSSDGFHPNDVGYAFLADVLFGPATTGTSSPPRAACSAMTMF